MAFTMTGSLSLYPKKTDGAFTWSETVAIPLSLANGTGVNQANGYWSNTLTIDAGNDETVDLLSLPFSAFNGTGTVELASVKSLIVVNQSAVTKITMTPGVTDGWDEIDGSVSVGPSGVFVLHSPVNGLPVTGTSKTVTITNTNAVTTLTGDTTTGSGADTITGLSSTSGLAAGMAITGTGIPAGTKIQSITNGTTLVMTASATVASGSGGVSLDFQWPAATVRLYAAGILN